MIDPVVIGLIGLGTLVVLIMLRVPVGATMGAVGFVGLSAIIGLGATIPNLAYVPFEAINRYEFAVIPLFTLMGAFVAESGIGQEAYTAARAWVGHIRGGLAMASLVGCGLFAATSGSSLATAVTMGRAAFPEMKRLNYADTLSIGCVAAGGSLGMLIPPSMAFVLIGVLTDVSIGQLFMAGIIPGILEIVFYCITIYIMCRFKPQLGPAGPKTTAVQKITAIKDTWAVILLFLLVMGGIYGGVFTAAEAGAVGAFGALVIALVRKRLPRSAFADSLMDTAKITAMIIAVLIGAYIFMRFLTITRIPFIASEFIVSLGISRYLIISTILISFIILGTFFDMIAVLTVSVPILFPIIISLGFDPLWFGVLMVRMLEMGFVTPPFGINLFAVAGASGVPMITVYRGVIPFVISDVMHVALLVAIPQLSTWLPGVMMSLR